MNLDFVRNNDILKANELTLPQIKIIVNELKGKGSVPPDLLKSEGYLLMRDEAIHRNRFSFVPIGKLSQLTISLINRVEVDPNYKQKVEKAGGAISLIRFEKITNKAAMLIDVKTLAPIDIYHLG